MSIEQIKQQISILKQHLYQEIKTLQDKCQTEFVSEVQNYANKHQYAYDFFRGSENSNTVCSLLIQSKCDTTINCRANVSNLCEFDWSLSFDHASIKDVSDKLNLIAMIESAIYAVFKENEAC